MTEGVREREREREGEQTRSQGQQIWFARLKDQTQRDGFLHDVNTSEGTAPSHNRMSGMDVPLVDHNETGISPIDNGTFLRFSPTSASTSAAASSPGRPGNVYVYVWLFLGLLVFLLTLLIISLHRLKNIISSSSSVPTAAAKEGAPSPTWRSAASHLRSPPSPHCPPEDGREMGGSIQ
ncbi:hypothetical protein INR49_011312 [Caranx melampygus]|nr:hypothetical protein INR49_011312 [Caranx melampygus]